MNPDTELVTVDSRIISSYSEKPLANVGAAGRAPRDVAAALLALCTDLPWLRVTELYREVATQAAARKRYAAWVAAGKPKLGTAGFNSKTMKADFVAKPGKSMHNAGRAIDVWLEPLRKNLGVEYLDAFWPIAAKHGFTPVIARPEEGKSESWHFDHRGCWDGVGDNLGYAQMALCAALAVGGAGEWQSDGRVMQALLLRAGWDVGAPDGAVGKRTRAGLSLALGPNWQQQHVNNAAIIGALRARPARHEWVVVKA